MSDTTYLHSHRRRIGALLTSVLVGLVAACSTSTTNGTPSRSPSTGTGNSTPTSPSSSPVLKAVGVHVRVKISDGATLGVGMPYIATFNHVITDGRAFQAATKVTVNGSPVDARWYFEYSDPKSGYVMEAHLRMQAYWPANAQIHVDLPVQGLSGGLVANQPGSQYVFDDSLTSDWATTDAHIVDVSSATHSLTVTDNGKVWGTFPVSLGATDTPTKRGIKVIMQKGLDVEMKGPGYDDPHVKLTQRLTYDGEYLHAAPWNCLGSPGCIGPANNIGSYNSSNGCTNLRPVDAQKLYDFLGVGDVVRYRDANGPQMQLGQGYGDWNVTWGLWLTGGVVKTQ